MQILDSIKDFLGSAYFMCVVGAFVLLIITRMQDQIPLSIGKSIGINVSNSGNPIVRLTDLALSAALGGFIVWILAEPATAKQSIVAGLGMSGLLSAYTEDA